MPKYVYETLTETNEVLRTFEVWQGINEPALSTDPENGGKVRRIISGTAFIGGGSSGGQKAAAPVKALGCAGSCRCSH